MTEPAAPELLIKIDDLAGPEITRLLERHLEFCRLQSPPDSMHALDLDALREREGLVFWSAWLDGQLVGCIALQALDPTHGEIKSMHTAEDQRGRGVARALVEHVLGEARRRSYRRLSLETGTMDGFKPARELYRRFGFEMCPPFGSYYEDPNSAFMTTAL